MSDESASCPKVESLREGGQRGGGGEEESGTQTRQAGGGGERGGEVSTGEDVGASHPSCTQPQDKPPQAPKLKGVTTYSSPIASATLACTSTASRASRSIRRAASSSAAASSPAPSEEEEGTSIAAARRARCIPRRCSMAAWSASSRRICCPKSGAESGVPAGLSTSSLSLCKQQAQARREVGEETWCGDPKLNRQAGGDVKLRL